ncbi:MAG TPA: amino acid permease, partial [Solirubrobacteraceae bacterium]
MTPDEKAITFTLVKTAFFDLFLPKRTRSIILRLHRCSREIESDGNEEALVATNQTGEPTTTVSERGFIQALGLFPATALNMAQMVGIGPFITIPLIISAMGGPQAILGWIVGAIIALLDGLVWAELGAAMPRSGGTYTFLREAFQYSTGRLMPFMFVWSTLLVT